MAVKRIKTGISGLDKLIEGGLPKGSTTLVSGPPGTGKTILGLQFLHYGAENNEPGIYLTIEETKGKIVEQAKQFGLDLEKLEKNGKLIINVMKEADITSIFEKLEGEAKEIGAKRLVIDSLSMMSIFSRFYNEMDRALSENKSAFSVRGRELTRAEIYLILKRINDMGLTTLMVSELPEKSGYLSGDTISEFACDGVILLNYLGLGGEEDRTLEIKKIRLTNQKHGAFPFVIGKKGIEVSTEVSASTLPMK